MLLTMDRVDRFGGHGNFKHHMKRYVHLRGFNFTKFDDASKVESALRDLLDPRNSRILYPSCVTDRARVS